MSTTGTRGIEWTEQAADHLLDAQICPVCAEARLEDGRCPACGIDLTGSAGADLWAASVDAARALRNRANIQRSTLLTRTPARLAVNRREGEYAAPVGAPPAASPVTLVSSSREATVAPTTREVAPVAPALGSTPGASLQSVLATAGAALFAVAAIVFTFFNPDLADRAVRSTIIGAVTLIFLGGAWLLARRNLQSSAEAVGGLGLVFVGLDVQAVAGSWTHDSSSWVAAAIATGVAGGLLLGCGLRARIRIWLWASLPALAAVPAMLGFAADGGFTGALLIVGSAFSALGLCALLPRFAARFAGGPVGSEIAAALPAPAGVDDDPVVDRARPSEAAHADERAAVTPPRIRRPFAAEAVSLTTVQFVATLLAIARILLAGGPEFPIALILAALAVHAVLAARHLISRTWAVTGGVLGAVAGAYVAAGLMPDSDLSWWPDGSLSWLLAVVVAGAAAVLVLTAVVPLPSRTPRAFLAAGALATLGLLSARPVFSGLAIGDSLLRGPVEIFDTPLLAHTTWSVVVALAVAALGLVAFGLCAASRRGMHEISVFAHAVAVLYGTEAVLALGSLGLLPLPAGIAVVLIAAVAVGAILLATAGHGSRAVRALLIVGGHLALVVAVLLSWRDAAIVPLAGVAAILVLVVLARTIAPAFRFLHVGAGYGYALVVLGTALSNAGVEAIALLCLTASAGLVGAIVATFLPWVGAREWQTILVVVTVPFAIGIAQVIFERSGWTALSTGLMFALALALLLTRRPGLTLSVRVAAAAMLVPTLAVVVVCLSAQLLAQSGSPVALPIIAVLVAVALPSGLVIRDGLVARGRGPRTADAARIAVEASALLTGVIAVGLALEREAAGLGTTCIVLLIIGIGAATTSVLAGRRYGWWVAAVAFTGALWSVWGLAGVDLPEAYLLPPTLGAALVGVVLTARGARAKALFACGLAAAVVPMDVLLAMAQSVEGVPWRGYGLLLGAWALIVASTLIGRAQGVRMRRIRVLIGPALVLAATAALGGTVQAVRWGTGVDAAPLGASAPAVILASAGLSALAASAVLTAALLLRSAHAEGWTGESGSSSTVSATGVTVRRAFPGEALLRSWPASRWLGAPAVLAFTAGVWPAIERDWIVIWTMWALMLGVLTLLVLAASGRGRMLPPALFLFTVAFVTAVVAWSPRDLRVEWFSLPLGVFLFAAGALGYLQRQDVAPRSLTQWPQGWSGSWPLLAPGLIVMMSASIVSTFTDPLTWRAILVMVLALGAILLGASRRLAAPFVIGLVVLPVENVFVFSVQLGRGVESMPWWITLATIGAVLLIIAVAGERREGSGRGVVARVRDLR